MNQLLNSLIKTPTFFGIIVVALFFVCLTFHYVARKQKFINFDDDYVSTEKIHGSNVSIIVDNENNIEVAKRTAFLTEEERTQRPWNTLAQFATEQKDLILSWTNQVRKLAEEYGNIVH